MTEQAIRVLVVEGNPNVATTMQTLLVDASPVRPEDRCECPAAFEVHWSDSLSSPTQRLAGGGIDVVLLDLSLPDSRGLDTFVKAHAASPHVPKIVLTVTDDDALVVTAVRAGLVRFPSHRGKDGRAGGDGEQGGTGQCLPLHAAPTPRLREGNIIARYLIPLFPIQQWQPDRPGHDDRRPNPTRSGRFPGRGQ